jgi:phage anti-repressor protein
MSEKFDIVKLIEKNPIARLSHDYQNALVNKIKERFTDSEQQLFAGSFYCYLNYDSKKEFVIDLDNVWKWIGFSRKDPAKRLLEKYFVEDSDYKVLLHQSAEQKSKTKKGSGGSNEEQIMMTVHTFKKFCLKAGTKKADDIHEYFIKLEEILQETINEETNELRNQLMVKDTQLEQKDSQLDAKDIQHKLDLKMKKHETLINILKTKKCVYIGEIEENKFIKIGSSKDIDERSKTLSSTFGNMIFLEVFESDHFREVEEYILNDSIIKKNLYRGPIKKNGKTSIEVVQLSDLFNYAQLMTIVRKYTDPNYVSTLMANSLLHEKKILDFEREKAELKKQQLGSELLSLLLTK